jgi:importin subunit alpha-2
MDAKIIQVALSGLENILRLGQQEAQTRSVPNAYAILIEECYGTIRKISFFSCI